MSLSRLLGRQGIRNSKVFSLRGGGGGPVELEKAPIRRLPEDYELIWHDGTANPEFCTDRHEEVTTLQALGLIACGFSCFGAIYAVASWKHSQNPSPFGPARLPYEDITSKSWSPKNSSGAKSFSDGVVFESFSSRN